MSRNTDSRMKPRLADDPALKLGQGRDSDDRERQLPKPRLILDRLDPIAQGRRARPEPDADEIQQEFAGGTIASFKASLQLSFPTSLLSAFLSAFVATLGQAPFHALFPYDPLVSAPSLGLHACLHMLHILPKS